MDDTVVVTEAHNLGGDRLRVRGTVGGVFVETFGWVSAMTNHYDPADYGADGHLKGDAKGRAMTKAERRDYCARLLRAAAPTRAYERAIDLD